ncbi:MAG: hypothetical protein KKD39_09095 [Candidatus Altiarchaeota archaeon]|nr:hypothetical protein [Candidatus Altiarchaeota archaeon]
MDKKIMTAALVMLALVHTVCSEQDFRKAVVMEMTSRQGYVTMDEVKVVYGVAPNFLPNFNDDASLKMVVRTDRDDIWWSRTIMDPRHCQISDDGDLDENEPHYVIKDSNDFTVVIPFKKNLRSMTVYDYSTGEVIGSFDLSHAIEEFCRKQVYDVECQGEKADEVGGDTAASTTSTTMSETIPVTSTTQPRPPGSVTQDSGGGVVGGIVNFFRGILGR